jgi:transcriptional regulator with XRE-family HTH domain
VRAALATAKLPKVHISCIRGRREMKPIDGVYQDIGKLIRMAREEENLTQHELGELVGLKRSSITNIEQGRHRIQVHTLMALAEALRLSPQILIPGPPAQEKFIVEDKLLSELKPAEKEWAKSILSYEEFGIRSVEKANSFQRALTRIAMAQRIQERANTEEVPVPIEKIARELGIEIRYAPHKGLASGFIYQKDQFCLIGVNSLQNKARQRFTIAHLIGHRVYEEGLRFHLDRGFNVSSRANPRRATSKELRACRFATSLLLPKETLAADVAEWLVMDYEDETRINNLAERYGVSAQLIIFTLCVEELTGI